VKRKSILTVILALTVLGAAAFPTLSGTVNANTERKTAIALYAGTAPDFACVLEGKIDPVWDGAYSYDTDEGYFYYVHDGYPPYASGYFKALWDERNLYLLAVIEDTTPAEYDAVIFYISEQNTQVGRDALGTRQAAWATSPGDYILPIMPGIDGGIIAFYDPSIERGPVTAGYAGNPANAVGRYMSAPESYDGELAVGFTEQGYIVQVGIPFRTEAAAGKILGFTVSVDDYYPNSYTRKAYCEWFYDSNSDTSPNNGTNGLAQLSLFDDSVVRITVNSDYPQITANVSVSLLLPSFTDAYGQIDADYTVTVKNSAGMDVTDSAYNATLQKLTFPEAGVYTIIYTIDSPVYAGALEKTITVVEPDAGGENNGGEPDDKGEPDNTGCGSASKILSALAVFGAGVLLRKKGE